MKVQRCLIAGFLGSAAPGPATAARSFATSNLGSRGAWSLCLTVLLAAAAPNARAGDIYKWSPNVAVAPFTDMRQQGETALATDAEGHVWLSFLDAPYHRVNDMWLAWPRNVRLLVSTDAGRQFAERPSLSEAGTDEALAAGPPPRLYATYIDYQKKHVALQRLDAAQPPLTACLPDDANARHDQSSLHIGADNVIHIVGVDINGMPANPRPLLYARSTDDGVTCRDRLRLERVGQLPQVVDARSGLMIVGPGGYHLSRDHGASFAAKVDRQFGAGLARAAISPDRKTVYVVGDATEHWPPSSEGLRLHATADGGQTWKVTRVDDAAHATEWRFPAVSVEQGGRIHVAWMDNRAGTGAVYHAYSDDGGAHFSPSTRVSDAPFPFPANAPPPPPANQDGTWVGDYLSLTTTGNAVIVAWSDQREGKPKSMVRIATGKPN